jgi:hypothetical protein
MITYCYGLSRKCPHWLVCRMLPLPAGWTILGGSGNFRRWGLSRGSKSLGNILGGCLVPGSFCHSLFLYFLSIMRWIISSTTHSHCLYTLPKHNGPINHEQNFLKPWTFVEWWFLQYHNISQKWSLAACPFSKAMNSKLVICYNSSAALNLLIRVQFDKTLNHAATRRGKQSHVSLLRKSYLILFPTWQWAFDYNNIKI